MGIHPGHLDGDDAEASAASAASAVVETSTVADVVGDAGTPDVPDTVGAGGAPVRDAAAAAVLAVGAAVAPVTGGRPAVAPDVDGEPHFDQTTTSELVPEPTDGSEQPSAADLSGDEPHDGLAGVLDIDDLHETLGMDSTPHRPEPDGRATSTTPAIERSPVARPMTQEGMPAVDTADVPVARWS